MRLRPALLAGCLLLATAAPAAAQTIAGIWRGTSACVDHVRDPACRDEVVVYTITPADSPAGSVILRADKIIAGTPEFMYSLPFTGDSTTRTWWAEFAGPRFSGRWEYTFRDSTAQGTLVELPTSRLVRRITLRRSTDRP